MLVQIGPYRVGEGQPCFVIAEAGSNHDGRLDQAKRLITAAKEAGADAVKFQTFRASKMYPKSGARVEYLEQLGLDRPIYEIIRELEMPPEWVPELAHYCETQGIIFLSTPFDEGSADLLDSYVPAFKIASYELTHIPLLRHVARKGKPMIMSTGGAVLSEIADAVAAVRSEGNDQICLMQCTAKYPAPVESLDVRALDLLRSAFGVPVGLSDHSAHPIHGPAAAVARDAAIVEKHFTLSRRLPGPDHSFALEPDDLRLMVETIRGIERALGRAEKSVREVERELVNYRRSVFTLRAVRTGERFTTQNVAVLRRTGTPDPGVPPAAYEAVLGKRARRDVEAERPLTPDDVIWET